MTKKKHINVYIYIYIYTAMNIGKNKIAITYN